MTITSEKLLATLLGVACLLLVSTDPTIAATQADAPDTVQAYVAAHPGGVAINDNEISYYNGDLIITLAPRSGVEGMPDCPFNYYCLYDRMLYGYPRAALSACTKQSLSQIGFAFRAESAYYYLPTGYAIFYYYDTPLYSVSADRRGLSSVPAPNQANYVRRFC